jgi:hypothetical protein
MHARLLIGILAALGVVGSAHPEAAPKTCEIGSPVTISGKISSVVAREETHWSIWLNRAATECSVSAVVVEAEALPTPCRPGSRLTASGDFDGSDTLRSTLSSLSCEP